MSEHAANFIHALGVLKASAKNLGAEHPMLIVVDNLATRDMLRDVYETADLGELVIFGIRFVRKQ